MKDQYLQNIRVDNIEEISTTFKYDGKDYMIKYLQEKIDEEKSTEELMNDFRKYLDSFDLLMLIINYENYLYLSNIYEYYAKHIDDEYGCY